MTDGRYKGLAGAVPLAHFFLRERLREGDRVVDATCGNGHDTLLLARLVGPTGRVWAFDVQPAALAAAADRLAAAGCRERVDLLAAGHERLAELVAGPLQAVVFNLGYLPGGDRQTVTRPESTVAALVQALPLLAPGGMILLAVYTGHPGGEAERQGVEQWAAGLPPARCNVWRSSQLNRSAAAPSLILVETLPER